MADFESFQLTLKARPDSLDERAIRNRQAIYDVYANSKGEKLWDLLADDVVFREADSLPYGTTTHGLEGARQGVMGMFEPWASLKCEIEELVAAGDMVIAYMHLTGVGRKTGKVYEGPTAELFRFNDAGKIVEWRPIYWDTHAVRVVCGVSDAE